VYKDTARIVDFGDDRHQEYLILASSVQQTTATPLSIKAKNWNPGTPEISVYPTSI
jgi:hypothetical protein